MTNTNNFGIGHTEPTLSPEHSGSQQQTNSTYPSGTGRTRDMNTGSSSGSGDLMSKFTDAAQQVGQQAREAATSLASEAGANARTMMNRQVGVGAEVAAQVAHAVKMAADDLAATSPTLAGLVRLGADRVDQFSQTVRGQSVEEMYATASDFVRRRPALVFGTAAVAGFVLFRLLRVAPSGAAPGHSHAGSNRASPGQPRDNQWSSTQARNQWSQAQGGSNRRPGGTRQASHDL